MHCLRVHLALATALLACLLAPGTASAVDITGDHHPLSAEFEHLADPTGTLTLEHILENPSAHPFRPAGEASTSASFTPTWLKLELSFSEATRAKTYYLFSRIENLYDLRLYRPDGQGGYSEWVTGNHYPASTREVDAPRYGFIVEPSQAPQTLYLRMVGGPGAGRFPWDLAEKQTYLSNSHTFYVLDVAAFSAIATLLIFNLFIALSLRKAEYLFYSGYVFSVAMGLATLDGLGFYHLWPESPELNSRALHTFNLLSSATRLMTILAFLGISSVAPRLYRSALGMLSILGVGVAAVALVGVTGLPPYAPTTLWALGILFGFLVCGYAVVKRVRLAIPLLIALLVPSVMAALQGFLALNASNIGVLGLQIAKLGFVIHVLMFSLCLAAQIKIETESRIIALHDTLTGLPGATLLQERFELAANLCRRQGMKTAVCFLDLDGFKAVNDTLGHAAGDQLLVQLAGRIQVELRRTDTVARIGGDEFVVLLTQVKEAEGINQVAEKLLTSVAKPYLVDGQQAEVTASIGIAMFPDQAEDLADLLSAADAAMYESKGRGKNTYTWSRGEVIRHPSQFGKIARVVDSEAG